MLKEGILYLEGALAPETCAELRGIYDSGLSHATQRDYNGNPAIYFGDLRDEHERSALACVGVLAGLFIREWFNKPAGYLESVFLQRKGPKDIIEPHYDNVRLDGKTPNHTAYRTMSSLFYLSKWGGGGEIVFPDQGRKIMPSAGSFLAFPSGHPYLHYVEPVVAGLRYSAPVWFTEHKDRELRRRGYAHAPQDG